MHYCELKFDDIANGPGIRVTLYVSGCTHRCKNCFNEVSWDFMAGEPFTEETIDKIINAMNSPYVQGLTLLGGEPFEHSNQIGLIPLVKKVKEIYKNKDIWCFTGYLFDDDIMNRMYNEWPETQELLSYIDVLVDGPFVEEKKSLMLKFKGSSNQRTIDVQKSLKTGSVEILEGF